MLLKDPYFTGYRVTIKNFGDILPRPKFFEESDGAPRFLIGPRSFVVNTVLLGASYEKQFYEIPLNKSFFTPKERGPIKKRVAPSDSSKNFGLGGMSPKSF